MKSLSSSKEQKDSKKSSKHVTLWLCGDAELEPKGNL
jgi:hypothetical protein